MTNRLQPFVLNRRQQRKQRDRNPPFPLFAPVQILLLLTMLWACGAARAQCYIDPFTGQQICSRQAPSRRLVSDSPGANAQSSAVDPSAHCRISVADGTMGSGTLVAHDDTVGLVLTCSHL